MYAQSVAVKQSLMKKAKLELEETLRQRRELEQSLDQDSNVAMELLLLQHSMTEDGMEIRTGDQMGENITDMDKSHSITLQLQSKIKFIMRKKKQEARAEILKRLEELEQ